MRRPFVGLADGAGGLCLLSEFHEQFAVLLLQREQAFLKVGHHAVERVDEVLAVGDPFFQLLTGCLVFVCHRRSIAHSASGRNGNE